MSASGISRWWLIDSLTFLAKAPLAYTATRPRYGTSTGRRWRGAFGQAREVFTFEAKIEHVPAGKIVATDLGQAHNQRTRAEAEFVPRGYTVRGSIITHMTEVKNDVRQTARGRRSVERRPSRVRRSVSDKREHFFEKAAGSLGVKTLRRRVAEDDHALETTRSRADAPTSSSFR